MEDNKINVKPLPVFQRLKELEENNDATLKTKKLKQPRKSKVKKRGLKKGYIGILKIDENGNISGEKQVLSESSYKLNEGTYHASDGRELLMWDGKFPVLIQPTWKVNPINVRSMSEKNETYGQAYVMAKMLKDAIKVKNKKGGLLIWVLLGAAAIFGFNYLSGGILFG